MNKLTLKVKKCTFVIFCNIKKSYPKEQAKVFSDDMLHQHHFFIFVFCQFTNWISVRSGLFTDTKNSVKVFKLSLFTHLTCFHNTRHCNNNNLSLPFTRTSHHQFNMSYRGPALWNVLPTLLRSISSHSLFSAQKTPYLFMNHLITSCPLHCPTSSFYLPHVFITSFPI